MAVNITITKINNGRKIKAATSETVYYSFYFTGSVSIGKNTQYTVIVPANLTEDGVQLSASFTSGTLKLSGCGLSYDNINGFVITKNITSPEPVG